MRKGDLSFIAQLIQLYSRCRQNVHMDRLLEENAEWIKNSYLGNRHACSGKKYMVIRKKDPNNGLSAYIMSCLVSIDHATRKGMIPVIDMQSYSTPYLEEYTIGKRNLRNISESIIIYESGMKSEDVNY